MARRARYSRLEDHPRLGDVRALLDQVPRLSDDQLRRLAAQWRDGPGLTAARRRALSPDTVLVVDTLRAFEDLAAAYADDLAGAGACPALDQRVVVIALKAVRDAIAGTIARPVLRGGDYALLTAPWRSAVGASTSATAVGGSAAVQSLLASFSALGGRCHDGGRRRTFDGLVVRAMTRDTEARDEALEAARAAAVRAGRRRSYALLRATTTAVPAVRCGACSATSGGTSTSYDDQRVASLAADAACGLLVADVVSPGVLDTLLAPLSGLVPLPRPATDV